MAAIDAADIAKSASTGVNTVSALKVSKGSGFLATTIVLPGRIFDPYRPILLPKSFSFAGNDYASVLFF